MRPKVSHACSASQSGACSLIEATSPNTDAITSHTTAPVRAISTGSLLDASRVARSSASSGVSTANSPVCPVRFMTPCSSSSVVAVSAAGSSTRPISLGAKITRPAASPAPKRPRDIDQRNSPSAATDPRNVTSNKPTENCMPATPVRARVRTG